MFSVFSPHCESTDSCTVCCCFIINRTHNKPRLPSYDDEVRLANQVTARETPLFTLGVGLKLCVCERRGVYSKLLAKRVLKSVIIGAI